MKTTVHNQIGKSGTIKKSKNVKQRCWWLKNYREVHQFSADESDNVTKHFICWCVTPFTGVFRTSPFTDYFPKYVQYRLPTDLQQTSNELEIILSSLICRLSHLCQSEFSKVTVAKWTLLQLVLRQLIHRNYSFVKISLLFPSPECVFLLQLGLIYLRKANTLKKFSLKEIRLKKRN